MHFRLDEEHPEATVKQEGAEEVEDPIHHGDQCNAEADHQAAHDQRAENAPVKDAMLVLPGDAEIGEDEGNDKHIVHRERQLDQITGDKLEGLLLAAQGFEDQGEEHREGKPDEAPNERFLELDGVGVAMENAQIERQEDQDAGNETNPVPGGDFNQGKHAPRKRLLPHGSSGAFDDAYLCSCAKLRSLTFVPPEDQRAGDVDAGVGACNDANEKGEGKVVNRAAAKDIKRQGCQEYSAGGDNGAAQGLVDRLVYHFAERSAGPQLQVLADTVKDNYGVVGGKADNRQDGGDGRGVEFAAGEEVPANRHR